MKKFIICVKLSNVKKYEGVFPAKTKDKKNKDENYVLRQLKKYSMQILQMTVNGEIISLSLLCRRYTETVSVVFLYYGKREW